MNRAPKTDYLASITLVDIADAAWSKRWSGAALFLLLACLFGTLLMLLPNRYVSNAQMLVRLGRGAVSMDPTTSLGQTVSLQESRINQVNSVVELMRSREIRERIVKRVGLERVLEPTDKISIAMEGVTRFAKAFLPAGKVTEAEGGLTAQEIDDMKTLADACAVISSDFQIHSPKDSYTIAIEFVSNSPFLSRDVVAAFVEEYPSYHIQAHQSTGALEFFEQETQGAFAIANEAQEKVRKLKAENGIIDLDSSKEALRGELTQVEREINQTVAELASTKAQLGKLELVMRAMPGTIESETVTGISKHSGDLIRDRFFDLEIQAKELSAKLKPDHPKLVALAAQLDAARAIADKEIGQSPQVREIANPNLQQMDLSARTFLAQQAGLEAKQEILQTQFIRVQEDLVKLNQVGAELTKLTWDADVAESMYRRTADRLANARQIAALEQQEQLSDVSVAQGATLELKKVGPKRLVMAVLAVAVAAGFSFVFSAFRGLVAQAARDPNRNKSSGLTVQPSPYESSDSPSSDAYTPDVYTDVTSPALLGSASKERGTPYLEMGSVMDKPVPR